MIKKALILNDYTNDLIANNGALFCGDGAQRIGPMICNYLRSFIDHGDYVAVCLDSHTIGDPFHPETTLFPAHNIIGSKKNELYGEVGTLVKEMERLHGDQIVTLRKCRYSAFVGTKLDLWLRERGITEITIAGVCTDMCVFHTAVDAYGKGYRITVPRSICFTPNEQSSNFVFEHLEKCMGASVPD